ncbi:hypothetical protein ACWGJ2_10840 [Streptomyces sp. NPDC054796]
MDPDGARPPEVTFQRSPDSYRHWTLRVEGPVARLELDVAEDGGLVPGYELKLSSYDLGVDIELYDALQRLRSSSGRMPLSRSMTGCRHGTSMRGPYPCGRWPDA